MDDRNWNEQFTDSKEAYRKLKTSDDKRMIEQFATSIEKEDDKWNIVFTTKFGLSEVVYFIDSGKWHKKIGKAKGKGAVTMLNYFNPLSREQN